MQFNNYLKSKLPFFVALSFTFVLASCGSYQYVGYESDGIYSDREVAYEEATNTESETATSNTGDNSYYKNYFNEKADQYSDIPDDERVIFTDIDTYEGEYSDENLEEEDQNGNAGWGQASNNITINYIDNGWNNNFGWNGYYGWNSWRYNNWGWNGGFGYYGFGWNTGWGYNNSYWCPPGFNGYYYNNRGLAYNSGRRGSNLAYANRNSVSRRNTSNITRRNSSTVSRRGSTTTRNNSASRLTTNRNNSSTIRRNTTRTRSNSSVRPRSNTRSNSTRTRSNNTRSNTRSNSNVTRPRSSSSSTRSNTRSTTPRRSSSTSTRSSSSSSRSSGTSSSSSRVSSSRRR